MELPSSRGWVLRWVILSGTCHYCDLNGPLRRQNLRSRPQLSSVNSLISTMEVAELVQSPDSPFQSFNVRKPCGTGSRSSVIFLIRCIKRDVSANLPSNMTPGRIRERGTLGSTRQIRKGYNLLESLYNGNKALLDQHNLDIDVPEGARRVCVVLPPVSGRV